MKFLFLLMALSLFPTFAPAQDENKLAELRANVNAINKNLRKFAKTTKDVEDISLEGTEATFYASGSTLEKVSAKMYGETYQAAADFYYKDDKLIFAFYRLSRYDGQIGLDKPVKIAKTEEKRLYFVDGKLEKLLVGKYNVKQGSKQWEESNSDIVELSEKFRAAFSR